jgi:hypothetical protein
MARFNCGPLGFNANISPGGYLQNDSISLYLAPGISYTTRNQFAVLQGGITHKANGYLALRYSYHFASFTFKNLNPFTTWTKPPPIRTINQFGRLYIGSTLKTELTSQQLRFVDQNIHLGIVFVNNSYRSIFSRAFVHYGVGYDYLQRTNLKPYGVLEFGLTFRWPKEN